jgi:hypothetical protein
MAESDGGFTAGAPETDWESLVHNDADLRPPMVESPPLAADWPDHDTAEPADEVADQDDWPRADAGRPPLWRRLLKRPAASRTGGNIVFNLPATTAAMGALSIALLVWRADVVRLMPQTAAFYKMAGLEVNLRGVSFKDLKVATETVDGKPVLVIEGMIVSTNRKPVELPRLRFSVRDAQGAEIYAWNMVLDHSVLKPGERATFRSRLASPPAEGRDIDVRFFNRRDLAAGDA